MYDGSVCAERAKTSDVKGQLQREFFEIFPLNSLFEMENVEEKMENVNISNKKTKGGKKSKGKDECCDVQLEVSSATCLQT